jgi:hypothetical protein
VKLIEHHHTHFTHTATNSVPYLYYLHSFIYIHKHGLSQRKRCVIQARLQGRVHEHDQPLGTDKPRTRHHTELRIRCLSWETGNRALRANGMTGRDLRTEDAVKFWQLRSEVRNWRRSGLTIHQGLKSIEICTSQPTSQIWPSVPGHILNLSFILY